MKSPDIHIARLLLLINEITRRSGSLAGLTKLAKLDFLLRYPAFLEVLNESRNIVDLTWSPPTQVELDVIDAPMIRYRYGPWDHMYYSFIGGLVGRGIVDYVRPEFGRLALRSTKSGTEIAVKLAELDEWKSTVVRAEFLGHHYNLSGTELKGLIYSSFPVLVDQPIGTPIEPEPVL